MRGKYDLGERNKRRSRLTEFCENISLLQKILYLKIVKGKEIYGRIRKMEEDIKFIIF